MIKPVLAAYGLTFGYDRRAVLEDVSFEVTRGELVALIGPNGCGKSTLMKLISGIQPLRGSNVAGQVHYSGQPFFDLSSLERAQRVAYLPPDVSAQFPITAHEAVLMGRICQHSGFTTSNSARDLEAVRAAMERAFCWEFRNRDLHTLSGGERQLVGLARTLAQGAKVLLLDESLSRMDLNHQAKVGRLLRELVQDGYSILLVAHDLNLACEWADRCLMLQSGKVVATGSVRDVLTEERVRSLYPGADLCVSTSPSSGVPKVFFGKP